jgi:hypothetical protein
VSIDGIGRAGQGVGRELGDLGGGEALADDLDALTFEALDAFDAVESEALEGGAERIGAEALARLAGAGRTVDDAVAAPAPEHVARALAAGRISEALARVVRRGARPGESAQEQRMRALVARLLELRHEAAAGMAKVSVG